MVAGKKPRNFSFLFFHFSTDARRADPIRRAKMLVALGNMLLAVSTGAFAGTVATYSVLHQVWTRARLQGDAAGAYTQRLERMRGVRAPKPTVVRAPRPSGPLPRLSPAPHPAAPPGAAREVAGTERPRAADSTRSAALL